MEKIGSTNDAILSVENLCDDADIVNYLNLLNSNWQSRQLLNASKEQLTVNIDLASSLIALKKTSTSKNIHKILYAEYASLTQEATFYANSLEEKQSVKMALLQIDEAKEPLNMLTNDKKSYALASKAFSSKRKEAGLPIDAFREFIKSHMTRLSNRLASPLSIPEKNLIRQRKENLSIARDVYIAMQREALGISKGQDKDRGIER